MEYRYDSAVGEVVFGNHTITLKGKVIPYEKIKSFDLVEFNPEQDIDNKTEEIATYILDKVIKEKD